MATMTVKVTDGLEWIAQAQFEVRPKASKQHIAAQAVKALGWNSLRVRITYGPYCIGIERKEAKQDAFVSLAMH